MPIRKQKYPTFEKIHAKNFYRNIYYNPDMDSYIAFSDEQLEVAMDTEWDLINGYVDILDYPSAYHVKSESSRLPSVIQIGPLRIDMINIGSLFGPQEPSEHMGMSFRNINPRTDKAPFLAMREKDVAQKQMLGQMFLANGEVATLSDYKERRDSILSNMAQGQPQNKESFTRKLRSLLYSF
ncbi:MAG TPA: hypothetical protein VGF14_03170 [Alphaproteobacteria bacterium]